MTRRHGGNLPRAVALHRLVDATTSWQRQAVELIAMGPTSVGTLAGRFRQRLRRERELAEHVAKHVAKLRDQLDRGAAEAAPPPGAGR